MKILIADDDESTRLLLTSALTNWDYEVTSAEDGDQALALLSEEGSPSMAVLDWMMPGLDGPEVCRRVRALEGGHSRYLLLLTARSGMNDVVQGLDAGANDYVVKPFVAEELKARLAVGRRVVELQDSLARRITELQEALDHVKQLIPICMHCHKIRNDEEIWERVDHYLVQRGGLEFTHSLCPECLEKHYPR